MKKNDCPHYSSFARNPKIKRKKSPAHAGDYCLPNLPPLKGEVSRRRGQGFL